MISLWSFPGYFFFWVGLSEYLFVRGSRPVPTASVLRSNFLNFMLTSGLILGYSWWADSPGSEDNIYEFFGRLLCAAGFADVWFYATHRLLHTSVFYSRVHKIHHRSFEPTPWCAYACHPFENLVSNAGTVIMPHWIVGGSDALLYVWIVAALCNSLVAHAGPVVVLGREILDAHDDHHRLNNCEYGINLFMDSLCGTTKASVVYEKKREFCE